MYARSTYSMDTFTLTVPSVDNDGRPAPYLEKVRAGLEEAGFTGWTETACVGYWLGKFEPGTVITLYVPESKSFGVASKLAHIGRQAMPDQEAVQVTRANLPTVLVEA